MLESFLGIGKNIPGKSRCAGDWVTAEYVGYVEDSQSDRPDDFVLATGEYHSVREFVEAAFKEFDVGNKVGGRAEEIGINKKTGQTLIEIDPKYYRPTEVDSLLGDATKARDILDWKPTTSFSELVSVWLDRITN